MSPTLTAIYRAQPAARKLFDWILAAGVEDNRTTVGDLMEQCDVSRRQSITVLRALADAGCGEFKVGRKGHPSRLEWARDPRALADKLAGAEALDELEPERAGADESDGAGERHDGREQAPARSRLGAGEVFIEMFPNDEPAQAPKPPPSRPRRAPPSRHALIEHTYVLRPNLRLVVELPEDLSAREAEVLGEWVKNLSFER